MDWTLEGNMVNGLIFCTRLTSRRSGHTHLCKHGRRKDFFLGWGLIVDFSRGSKKRFSRGGKSSKISFYPPKTKKTTFFAKNLVVKCQISNYRENLGSPAPARVQRSCVQTGAETSDTAAVALEPDPARCSWRASPAGRVVDESTEARSALDPFRIPSTIHSEGCTSVIVVR